ncbi:ATP-dependent DNA helicase RecQ [Catenovulum maritimum]|uniref:ATP-dependent DNA helicase RecQ n=1 Tax=Catenovulum maritimum TaxID=1513271 RepID=A0A0J8GYG2_9ALTE|nr:RecQ family ATP-dependent DNA helicase [Catenovulum maritimum]KMT65768.1 ATP-dependent DNA helicase RecQ [Catenovulum maritimum]
MEPNLIKQSLAQYFGFEEFRTGQAETIAQLLNGNSSLAIFPTGSGKSLCYQLTALHLPNLTLVVSPLLALMRDQLDFLASKGISAASLDSSLTPAEYQQVLADVNQGKIKILMISVERFKNERFRQFIQGVAISMLVVDEAHCISEWGHNFRPDYLKLPSYCEALNIPLVLLLTATATKKVKLDMASRFGIELNNIVQTGFYRSNLDISVVSVAQVEKKRKLADLIQAEVQQAPSVSGIIYVTLQQTAEEVAQFLRDQGINAQAYHAGLADDKRKTIQLGFMQNEINIVVATIAFGMGVDKSNIRFVMHYDLPKSIENYSQEIGRAGRDGLPSRCTTLANLDGLNVVENFVYGDTPEPSGIEAILANIQSEASRNYSGDTVWEMQINQLSSLSNIRQLPLKTLLVQLELESAIQPLYSYYAEFKIKLLVDQAEILSKFNLDRQAFLKAIFEHVNFKKVWGELDFNALYQAYHTQLNCERSRVIAALEYLQQQGLIEVQTKLMTEVFQVNLDRLGQAGLAHNLVSYFTDKAEKEIKRIASLIRFFELDRCLSQNLARYFDDDQVPENCGHCSVCRGEIARLTHSKPVEWPEDAFLLTALNGLTDHLTNKLNTDISLESYCRFLAGISVPMFSRYKVRQLKGFACCENFRYAEIKEKVIALNG